MLLVSLVGCADAEVLFEYEKTREDELDLKPGEIIRNVIEVGEIFGGIGVRIFLTPWLLLKLV